MGTLEAEKTERKGNGITIECCKADDLIFGKGFLPPTIIKIDTEGHEPSVLRGMSGLIAKYRPVIFFEHISMSDEQVQACIPPGYGVYSVSDSNGATSPGFNRQKGHNSALIPN